MSGNDLITNIRVEIEDEIFRANDVHNWEGDNVFTLWESNPEVSSITIYINGTNINNISGATFSYNSINNKVTISYSGFIKGDVIVIEYNHYPNYSDTVIKRYINIALDKVAIYYPKNLEILDNEEGTDFTIIDKDEDDVEVERKYYALIAYITAILIKPDWLQYRAIDLNVRYRQEESRYNVIKWLIDDFKDDRIGIWDTIIRNKESGEE